MGDKVSNTLKMIILDVEDKLWLSEANDIGLQYAQADLKLALTHVRTKVKSVSPVERTNTLSGLNKAVEPLYKITSVAQFKNIKKLDYADYASVDKIRDVLLLFTIESSITREAARACNIIADVLCEIDSTRPNYKNSLSYKYMRAFLLLVLIGDYASASCIATFILTQLVI